MNDEKKRIHLINEFNCYETQSKASIWVVPGNYDLDEDEYDELGIKILGPVQPEIINETIINLKTLFGRLGFDVIISESADD